MCYTYKDIVINKFRYKVKRVLQMMKKRKEVSSNENYKKKIMKHKMAAVNRFLMVVAVVSLLALVVYMQYRDHVYTDYDYISQSRMNKVVASQSIRLGDCILTYSNDGAHCTDMDGVEVWNQTYEMQSPVVKVCGNVVAIGDYNGREIYVLNTSEKICQINTTMPIKNLAVAENGRVAVEVIDGKITWLYIYKTDGTMAYEKKTTMSQSGYPAAFSLSPNGELLAMSCIFVDAGVVKSKVAFYNFGPVGENNANYEVNAYTYPEVIIPYIEFLEDDTVVAVGDDRVLFYTGDQIPTFLTMHMLESEVQSVYQGNGHLGLSFRSDVLEMRNKMDVYSASAEKLGTYYFNNAFHDVMFTDKYFVAYGDSECTVMTYEHVNKYIGTFDKSVDLMMPVGKGRAYKFVLISDNTINTIQMK